MGCQFTVVDLFGAPGGLALGFKMTGNYSISVCVDSDKIAAQTYQTNIGSPVITIPIEKVNLRDLLRVGGLRKNDVDVVIGGPPCSGFSIVGRVKIASLARNGIWTLRNHDPKFIDDPRNFLYKYFYKTVRYLSPKYFVMENVPGILSYAKGTLVSQIFKDFNRVGYHVEWRVLDASNYGVPQVRRRVFFIGSKKGLPNPFSSDEYADPDDRKKRRKRTPTVWEAIGDLPRLRAGEGDEKMPYDRKPFAPYQKWARKRSKFVHNHVARKHGERDLKLFKYMREGTKWKDLPARLRKAYGYRDDIFLDKIRRLRRNKPAWTITAHLAKDGYAYIHPTQNRTITVREAARLQSFPDTFIFHGSRTSQYKQVGNAVPPLMARAIASEISRMLQKGG